MVIVVRGWREKREGVESQMGLVFPLYHTHHLKDNIHTEMASGVVDVLHLSLL